MAPACRSCGRPALYFRRVYDKGRAKVVVNVGKGHDLCNRCHRDEANRQRHRA